MINIETKEADFSSDQGVKIAFNQTEIVSDHIAISKDGENTILAGKFTGVFSPKEESKSYFSYEGKLIYILDKRAILKLKTFILRQTAVAVMQAAVGFGRKSCKNLPMKSIFQSTFRTILLGQVSGIKLVSGR